MKVKVTMTAITEIDDQVYIDWLVDSEDTRDFTSMTDAQKLEVIKECEEESGYEIDNEIDDWKTEISAA